VVPAVLLPALIVSALFYYKWGASLRTLSAVHSSGKLAASPGPILDGGVLATTLAYFRKIWPALTYGILVGAALRTAIPAKWLTRWFGDASARPILIGAIAGAPLMLCSCCITPVFSGLHQRGARLGPSLAIMLSSPGLNIATLVLTFALLPPEVGIIRVAAALTIVLGLSSLIGRTMDGPAPASRTQRGGDTGEEPTSWKELLIAFAKGTLYLATISVPLLVAGVLLSGLLLPHVRHLTGAMTPAGVPIVALIATLAALPTFFEVPIALMLLSMGAPLPLVVAFVVAGPVVNLPSLLVLSRETGPRAAIALGAGVWVVATASGFAAMI
jgi:uncharacterized membrane protein YraQ (UPF0718 family)